MEVNSFEGFMAIATGLVTATKSWKFSKCCAFVRLVYDDLVIPGHLMIVHGRPSWTSLLSMGDFIDQEQYYCPWTFFLLLGWFLVQLALLALDDTFGRTGVGLIFHFPISCPFVQRVVQDIVVILIRFHFFVSHVSRSCWLASRVDLVSQRNRHVSIFEWRASFH